MKVSHRLKIATGCISPHGKNSISYFVTKQRQLEKSRQHLEHMIRHLIFQIDEDNIIGEISLDKKLDQLDDCIIKEIIRYCNAHGSRWKLG